MRNTDDALTKNIFNRTDLEGVYCDFCRRCASEQSADSDFWPFAIRTIDTHVHMCGACKRKHPNTFDFYFSEKEDD